LIGAEEKARQQRLLRQADLLDHRSARIVDLSCSYAATSPAAHRLRSWPQAVQTIRGQKERTGTSSGSQSALMTAL
jgi:hypothetical protein